MELKENDVKVLYKLGLFRAVILAGSCQRVHNGTSAKAICSFNFESLIQIKIMINLLEQGLLVKDKNIKSLNQIGTPFNF